ncbi:hypothetical protein BC567DRAFT_219698 [Phyllosticta citribraziliensis]
MIGGWLDLSGWLASATGWSERANGDGWIDKCLPHARFYNQAAQAPRPTTSGAPKGGVHREIERARRKTAKARCGYMITNDATPGQTHTKSAGPDDGAVIHVGHLPCARLSLFHTHLSFSYV